MQLRMHRHYRSQMPHLAKVDACPLKKILQLLDFRSTVMCLIPTSGANSPVPAQDSQASDTQGRSRKHGRPFSGDPRYAGDGAIHLLRRIGKLDVLQIECGKCGSLGGDHLSFARSFDPPVNWIPSTVTTVIGASANGIPPGKLTKN